MGPSSPSASTSAAAAAASVAPSPASPAIEMNALPADASDERRSSTSGNSTNDDMTNDAGEGHTTPAVTSMNNSMANNDNSTTAFPALDDDSGDSGDSDLSRVMTVGQERRASVSSVGASARSVEGLTRRLSRSFQESDPPRGFFAATADMTSSVVAAASGPRSRSGTMRTRSSTMSDPDERNKVLQQQRTLSRTVDGSGGTLATLDEQKQHGTSIDGVRPRHGGAEGVLVGATAAAAADSADSADRTTAGGLAALERPSTTTASDSATATAKDKDAGSLAAAAGADRDLFTAYDNGYHFPPRYSKSESFQHGLQAFWNYTKTPIGFLVVLYGLNIVAWGGMLFLLLCNAAPAMCHPTCNNIDSPRRKWIEVDEQILNGLFCVTGFGLAPWRFRDLYFYLQYRLGRDPKGLRRLAAVHRGWLRLPGSQDLPPDVGPGNVPPETPCHAVPFPESKVPDAPLTGERAPPTRERQIVYILGMNMGNTVLQALLAAFMWGYNRYDRPSWATGLFVGLGCVAGALGGLGMFFEGKRVKGIEGVPLSDKDHAKLAQDHAQGIYHYNNIKGKKPKEKVSDVEASAAK